MKWADAKRELSSGKRIRNPQMPIGFTIVREGRTLFVVSPVEGQNGAFFKRPMLLGFGTQRDDWEVAPDAQG